MEVEVESFNATAKDWKKCVIVHTQSHTALQYFNILFGLLQNAAEIRSSEDPHSR